MNAKRKERKFKKEYALELLRVAEGDLDSAKALHRSNIKRKENIFYHAEQSIEKCLKSAICAAELAVPLTHSLSELILTLPSHSQFPFGMEIDELTEFATTLRYQEGKAIFEEDDIQEIFKIADEVFYWAKMFVNKNFK